MATPFANLNIPPLQKTERISSWEKLFRAAITPMLDREDGEKLAVGLLPAYVCRRPAEKELAKDIVSEVITLKAAFEILITNLDPPVDPQQSMDNLCRREWDSGVFIDDYFYELRTAAEEAGAPLRMVCLLLTGQLPMGVLGKMKEWIADKEDINRAVARDFIVAVRRALAEKGIPLDRGHRDLNRLMTVSTDPTPQDMNLKHDPRVNEDSHPRKYRSTTKSPDRLEDAEIVNTIQYPRRGKQYSSKGAYSGSKERFERPSCYNCGDTNHFQRKCPKQYCKYCGKQGHNRFDCRSKRQVLSLDTDGELYPGQGPSGAVINIKLNNHNQRALLDSGAEPSIIDIESLKAMGTGYSRSQSRVYGVGTEPVATLGRANLVVEFGIGHKVKQSFLVLNSSVPTVILGRDFLRKFHSTEFDWENYLIRLGADWITSEATILGGKPLTRAEAITATILRPDPHRVLKYDEQSWNINPELEPNQKTELVKLLQSYSDVFAVDTKNPETTHTARHVIETGNAQPVRAKNIRVSPQTEREIKMQVDQMLRNGIIRASASPWASRVILVRKKDGSLRFAVDYRGLNDVTKKDSYPLPEVKDILDRLDGCQFYSTLDGASAYWSIPIKEADREKTSFITPRGQFEFNVMPFGLCNAPATYQRAIDSALKDATESLPYIDDTLTFSHSFEEHLQHLHQVLGCYRVANIQLRRDKCSFGFEEIKFWGHLLSKRGHEPLPSLVDKIQEQARPGNLKDLRSFLGLVNYYRDFIPHMAERAAPLYGLTKKGVKFSWDLSCEESFASLCKTLSQNPVTLAYPDWGKPFHLEVDASQDAIGAVLAQEDDKGKMRPISFASSTLDRAQRNYSTGEREAWAIVVATRRWRKYLQAADQVIIWSDHNPLEWLRKQKDPRGKFARWILELEPLNYIIRFRRGLDNLAADRLSRSATQYDFTVNDETEFFERHVYTILEDTKIQIFSIDSTAFTGKLLREQARDPIIRDTIEQLNLTGKVEKGQLKKLRPLSQKWIIVQAETHHSSYHCAKVRIGSGAQCLPWRNESYL